MACLRGVSPYFEKGLVGLGVGCSFSMKTCDEE